MCGICGFINYSGNIREDARGIITRMNHTLLHRGPDDQQVVLFDNVALGFSRLSIIGLENGMQPICSEDGNVMVICNGEIFNYIELREQLQQRGHVFRTSSDVEVIVHLYEECGMAFLEQLNGQYAFALYDKRREQLFCARDPMGIIPFFYTFAKQTFIFGSEIKAILQHPDVVREIDLTGLDQVFTFPGLVSPRTLFRNIHSLENGYYVAVDREGRLEKKEYWDLVYPTEEERPSRHPDRYYIEKLEELIERSVRLRLRADVPTGFYLSGGLDSSIIASKVYQQDPHRRNEAFSIDFVSSDYSEIVHQRLMANESNANLNSQLFFYDDISERLRKAIYHCECPIKETYNTASLALSDAVRKKDIKVVLSGEGADELFAGYIGYRFDELRRASPGPAPCQVEQQARRETWGDALFFYEHDFTALNAVKRNLFSHDLKASFDEFNCLNHPLINKERLAGRHVLHKRAYLDYKLRLVDHLVSDHGDRMALAHSVEVRYPFLDKDLVEFAATIPPDLKLRDFTEKYILKTMAADFLPESIVNREKFGFVAPGSPYLLQRKIPYINDLLSYDLIKRQGFFDPDVVEQLKRQYSVEGTTINVPFESDLLIVVITFGILQDLFF